MTYNFDPEKWFEIEEAALRRKRAAGELDDQGLAEALERLVEEYERLLRRTDIRYDYNKMK